MKNNHHIKVVTDYLELLGTFLAKMEAWVDGDLSILDARLTEAMFPLVTQAEIAMSFSLRACGTIAQSEVVSFAQEERSFAGLQIQLKQSIAFLNSLDYQLSDLTLGSISGMAGPVKITLPTIEFLHCFAFPNFFHLSMVYAIARANGVPATKGDFEGYYAYPVGFSFED